VLTSREKVVSPSDSQEIKERSLFERHTRLSPMSRILVSEESSSGSGNSSESIPNNYSNKSSYNPRIKDFDIPEEVSNLVGLSDKERLQRRKSTKTKPAQKVILDDIKVYQRGDDFIEWW